VKTDYAAPFIFLPGWQGDVIYTVFAICACVAMISITAGLFTSFTRINKDK